MQREERRGTPAGEGYLTTEDGVRLFFRTSGSGPRIVVIPNGIHLFDDFERLARGRTLIFYDLRNRGRSDQVGDAAKPKGGIRQDVDDLEAVRRHFGLARVDLIGHSYLGMTVVLYAMKYPDRADRVVQIGPIAPHQGTQYPPHLSGADATLRDVLARLARLEQERQNEGREEFCRRFWALLKVIYVFDPKDAEKIKWERCELENELNLRRYWAEVVFPSIRDLELSRDELARVKTPILTIHGVSDRSSPYGGGREWALMLGNARLVSVARAAHAPWVEAPEAVFGAIETFLGGGWPGAAESVEQLDPAGPEARGG